MSLGTTLNKYTYIDLCTNVQCTEDPFSTARECVSPAGDGTTGDMLLVV